MTAQPRPLTCTRCGSPVAIAEDFEGYLDWGQALIDADGTVRPAVRHFEMHRGELVRARAVCRNCGHEWTLRRRFDPQRGDDPPPEPRPVWQDHG